MAVSEKKVSDRLVSVVDVDILRNIYSHLQLVIRAVGLRGVASKKKMNFFAQGIAYVKNNAYL